MEIKFDKRNYRKHSDSNKRKIKKSLQECGAGRSVLVDADDTLIAGNGVFEQAQAMGIPTRVIETDGTELVVVKRTDLRTDDDKRKLLAMADNATSDNVEWEDDFLNDDFGLDVLEDWDIHIDLPVEQEMQEANEDDFDEDKDPVATICQEGDVWQLGEHRLMCGDSTKAEDVARLMDGERADIAFTSPPYNAGTGEILTGKTHQSKSKYLNSDDNLSNYDELLNKSTQNNIDNAKYAFVNIQMLAGNKIQFCEFVSKFKECLCDIAIWNKNNTQPAMARRVMNSQFEFIFIFSKDNPSRAVGTRDFRGTVSNVNNMNAQHKNEYSSIHAATFSVEFASYYITNFCNKGESVLDLFGGTGTTMIAAEQLGRKCYMMELDPHYCDVIIARWEKLTGQKAVKL